MLGDRDLERYQSNISTQNSGNGGQSGQSGGYQRATESVMLPASFGTDLYVDEGKGGGPTALVVTSKVAAVIKWPFPPLQVMRESLAEAPWIQPGFTRPVWGKVPLKVPLKVAMPGGGDVPPVKPDARQQKEKPQAQEQDIIYVSAPEQQQALPQDSGGMGESVEEAVADHMIGAALDAALTGGAGQLFEAMKGISELAGGGGGGAPVPTMIRQQQRRQEREQEQEPEDEAEAEDEQEA